MKNKANASRNLGSVDSGRHSRVRRLVQGWSANLVQLVLGVTQQVLLIPVFLHFWSSEVLAAWLVIYAIGNLILIADCGLQFRTINRFLAFKSSADCDGRTGSFYGGLLRIYLGVAGIIALIILGCAQLVSPSTVFKFRAIADFDAAFVVMATGTSLTLPVGVVAALYRARGLYGRAAWFQGWAIAAGQIGQLIAIVSIGSLLAVTLAYVAAQVLITVYLLAVDAPRLFPFLRGARSDNSPRWIIGQFRKAAPFGLAAATELTLQNLPVMLVSALVFDRVAVAQWGLTRVVAGLLRALCLQTALPLAAELGHDHAVGDVERLRDLYARGSMFVTVLASAVVSGLLPFWQDFFSIWTHGNIPYDPLLTIMLLSGAAAVAPAVVASSYANYSNRASLLLRTKGVQLAVFLALSLLLVPPLGPLGAAIAIVASDVGIQFCLLTLVIMRETLQHPLRHALFLAVIASTIIMSGWGVGIAIRSALPSTGWTRFILECVLWLFVASLVAIPLSIEGIRQRLKAALPR
ncbi:hypothetical protein [Bradyrhizobium sp. USDA 4449]